MSPRRSDPAIRSTLVEVAARILESEGPQAMSTRRIASEAGTSTMAVYTHFGGMSELVREIVHEGFARLERYLAQAEETGDPVADLCLLGRLYRLNALANSHLYAAMFGGSSLAGFELTDEDRQFGRYTLAVVVRWAQRCIDAGRFRPADAQIVAHTMWTALHGIVTLELGHYLIEPWTPERCLEAQLLTLMTGAGDALDTAQASVDASVRRVLDPESAGTAVATATQ